MIRPAGVRVATVVFVGLVALPLVGCGARVKPEGAAQAVVDVVVQQTGFRPNDVHCPAGVRPRVGKEFDCHFTGPQGKPYLAHLRITKVEGEAIEYDIKTQPSA